VKQRLLALLHRVDGPFLLMSIAVLVGLLVRVLGSNFCLPIEHCHPDEHYLVRPVMHMVQSGDLNPHQFMYPTAFMYILLGAFVLTFLGGVSTGSWGAPAQIRPPPFIWAGRLTAAGLGTGTLLGIWVAGKRLLDPAAAAVAVAALALMPLHVADSHFVATDVPAGFFSIVALCAAAAVAREGTKKSYIIAGLLVGFAGATKYNAALIAVNLPLAHWLNPRRERFWNANFLRALLWMALGFLIACPYALLDLSNFLDGVATEIAHYNRAHIGHEGHYNRIFYFLFLAYHGFGPVLTGLGLYGLVRMVQRFERRYLLLLVFPVLYIAFVGSYRVRFVRNLMPVLPYFALWIGFGAAECFRQMRASWPALARRPAWQLAVPLLLLAVAWPAYRSLDDTFALARPDTRSRARAWIERNLPRGSAIYLQAWGVDALTPGKYRISNQNMAWDYYVGTDRLSRKYFAQERIKPEKYLEVKEAFQHLPVAVFEGRPENPYYCTASPTVLIFARDPQRPLIKPFAPPPPPPPPPRPAPAPKPR
jgi:4-amino-4-deoxy-L-arabinose transferase-like glycosyltransferase